MVFYSSVHACGSVPDRERLILKLLRGVAPSLTLTRHWERECSRAYSPTRVRYMRSAACFAAIIRIVTTSELAIIQKAWNIWFQSHMNFSPQRGPRKINEQHQGFKSRLRFDNTVYKSASEALEAYIAQFEGGRSVTTYRRRSSDLLSPAPKFYFMDSLERSLRSPLSKSPARKVDELLEWVNVTYAKELSSKVAPFGYRTTLELPGSGK